MTLTVYVVKIFDQCTRETTVVMVTTDSKIADKYCNEHPLEPYFTYDVEWFQTDCISFEKREEVRCYQHPGLTTWLMLKWNRTRDLLDALAIVQKAFTEVAKQPYPHDLWKINRIANYICLQYIEAME